MNKINLDTYKPSSQPDYIDPPIMAIIAERGEGKTLLMTGLGYAYLEYDNYTIWSNYKITGYPVRYYSFEELSQFPEDLVNAVVLMDEGQVGVDAYQALFKGVKGITDLMTQLRKRNVILIATTQRYNFLARRFRQMVNYIIEVEKDREVEGDIHCIVTDRQREKGDDLIKYFLFKGKPFFKMYNTKEIIEL